MANDNNNNITFEQLIEGLPSSSDIKRRFGQLINKGLLQYVSQTGNPKFLVNKASELESNKNVGNLLYSMLAGEDNKQEVLDILSAFKESQKGHQLSDVDRSSLEALENLQNIEFMPFANIQQMENLLNTDLMQGKKHQSTGEWLYGREGAPDTLSVAFPYEKLFEGYNEEGMIGEKERRVKDLLHEGLLHPLGVYHPPDEILKKYIGSKKEEDYTTSYDLYDDAVNQIYQLLGEQNIDKLYNLMFEDLQ